MKCGGGFVKASSSSGRVGFVGCGVLALVLEVLGSSFGGGGSAGSGSSQVPVDHKQFRDERIYQFMR